MTASEQWCPRCSSIVRLEVVAGHDTLTVHHIAGSTSPVCDGSKMSAASAFAESTGKPRPPRTPSEWWTGVLASPEKTIDWLKRQYHAESVSARGLLGLIDHPSCPWSIDQKVILTSVADDEERHADLVGKLLRTRGCEPTILKDHKSRYVQASMGDRTLSPFEIAASASYLEFTSLMRFDAILRDPRTPADIRETFVSIAWDEEYHIAAFKRVAGRDAFEAAGARHRAGLKAVGIMTDEEVRP